MDLIDNQVEAGWLAITYFWPNQDYIEQGTIHIPEVILDTTAPNTPNNAPELLPSYQNLSSPLPPEAEPLEASAQNTAPSETSQDTCVEEEEEPLTEEEVQQEVNLEIQRAQDSINADQITFNGLTYRDLWKINITHHHNNPHLYNVEPETAGSSSLQQFPMDVSQEEEEQEEEVIERTESPLPIQVKRPMEVISFPSPMQIEQGEIISSLQLQENLPMSELREVTWTPNSTTIPTQEEWNRWIKHQIWIAFQEPGDLTPLD